MIPLHELPFWLVMGLIAAPFVSAGLVALYYELRYRWGLCMERNLYK